MSTPTVKSVANASATTKIALPILSLVGLVAIFSPPSSLAVLPYLALALAGGITIYFLLLFTPMVKGPQQIWVFSQFWQALWGKAVAPMPETFVKGSIALRTYILSLLLFPTSLMAPVGIAFWGEELKAFQLIGAVVLMALLGKRYLDSYRMAAIAMVNTVVVKPTLPTLETASEEAPNAAPTSASTIQVTLAIHPLDEAMEVPKVVATRLNAYKNRFPTLTKYYHQYLLLLWLGILLGAILTPGVRDTASIVLIILLSLPTLFWLVRVGALGKGLQKLSKGDREREGTNLLQQLGLRKEKQTRQVGLAKRPTFAPYVGWTWILIGLVLIGESLSQPTDAGLPFLGLFVVVAAMVAYLVLLRRAQQKLEKKHPVYAPLKLLVLRLFSSHSFVAFTDLIQPWRAFGITQYLEGPDSLGLDDVGIRNALRGSYELSVTKTEEELATKIGTYHGTPNANLQFPEHSLQCNDATWKQALYYFLEDTDGIVMDLTGLRPGHAGINFELNKLISEVPLHKVVMVIDESTDLELLKTLATEALQKAGPGSVNYAEKFTLPLYQHKGTLEKQAHESEAGYTQRIAASHLETNILGLLFRATATGKSKAELTTKLPIPWARPQRQPS